MARKNNTDRNGNSWSEKIKRDVWSKGTIDTLNHQDVWRRDKCGKFMNYNQHGNRDSEYGWEVDHINPVSNGGSDDLTNLQPLYWENNLNKGDKLFWSCAK